jgi:hypothetical protein
MLLYRRICPADVPRQLHHVFLLGLLLGSDQLLRFA